MKLDWNPEKNTALKETRHINFADIALLINTGLHYTITDNPGPKYPHQKVMTLIIDEYAYCIPCVEIEGGYFLKTIYPSRKATKKFLLH